MNEELRIIIKAITDEAKAKLQSVKDELTDMREESEKSSKAFSAMGKGALAAVGGVVALTTAMVALGKSSMEYQKAQGKLVSGFQSMGLSSQQAAETYKQLYGFLGDVNTATEASNLLAQITQDEKDLAQWTNILKGVYATFPDSLPVEALAEATNETIKNGVVVGNLADAVNWLGVSEDAVNAKLATLNTQAEREVYLRSLLNGLYANAAHLYNINNQALIAYNQSQAQLDQALADAMAYVIPLMTYLNGLAATLLQVLKPAFEIVSAVIVVFVQWLIAAIKAVGSFFGIFSSKAVAANTAISGSAIIVGTSLDNAATGAGKLNTELGKGVSTAKALKRQLMGFDELNVVSSGSSGGGSALPGLSDLLGGVGGGGGAQMPSISVPAISPGSFGLDTFSKTIDTVEGKMKGLLTYVGLVAAGLAGWKLTSFIGEASHLYKMFMGGQGFVKFSDYWEAQVDKHGKGNAEKTDKYLDETDKAIENMTAKLKSMLGNLMMIAGAALSIWGYMDAWTNGIDWGNTAALIGGLALAVGGVFIAFGKLAGAIGIVVAGLALVVIGVKDFITNGPTFANMAMMIGGAIAVAIGLATAGVSVLISVIVAAVVAVGAFVAALLLEEDGILSTKQAQDQLTAAKERAINAENSYINAIDAAEAAQERLRLAEEAAGMTGEELYAQVQSGALDYANMTAEQRELYKAYLNNEQKQADLEASTKELTEAKHAEILASHENNLALAKESGNYDDFKKSVVAAFEAGEISAEEARTLIEKAMGGMSDSARQTFMKDIPSDITNGLDPTRFETTKQKLGKFFKEVGKFIANIFIGIINSLVAIINTIIWPFKAAFVAIAQLFGVKINGGYSHTTIPYIPFLAKGGIVDSATLAVVGERGKEAVLPLENNTGWMDTLADRIAARNESNMPSKIVLMVGERELGYAAINSINGITRQTGELQLAMY